MQLIVRFKIVIIIIIILAIILKIYHKHTISFIFFNEHLIAHFFRLLFSLFVGIFVRNVLLVEISGIPKFVTGFIHTLLKLIQIFTHSL